MKIQKAGGELVVFDEQKLVASLRRSGATSAQAQEVLREISPKLKEGMTTKQLFRLAFQELKKASRPLAARYNLKKALSELGPSGYPFENLIAQILRREGYAVQVGQMIKGRCVDHEVDVVAKNGEETLLTECKFHNANGMKVNIKTPLYVYARFLDIQAGWGEAGELLRYMLASNTRFTEDSQKYGECIGMRLLSWDYPKGRGIRDLIDRHGVYPLTCLSTLLKREKAQLLQQDFILVQDVLHATQQLEKMGLPEQRLEATLDEARRLVREAQAGIEPPAEAGG
jgi:hypothetical protein